MNIEKKHLTEKVKKTRKKSNENKKMHAEKAIGAVVAAAADIGIFATENERKKIKRDYHISCMKSVRRLCVRFKSLNLMHYGRDAHEHKVEIGRTSTHKCQC